MPMVQLSAKPTLELVCGRGKRIVKALLVVRAHQIPVVLGMRGTRIRLVPQVVRGRLAHSACQVIPHGHLARRFL